MFFRRLLDLFVSPTKVFDDIRDSRMGWWQPWVWNSILAIVGNWLLIPAQQVMMQFNPKMTPETLAMAAKMAYVQLLFAPAICLIVAFLAAGISYPVVTLQSKEATFKKHFNLILCAQVVFWLGYVITGILLRVRGVDNIQSPEDLRMSFSLRMLAPEANAIVGGLLGSFEFFTLWVLALVVVGVKRVFNLRTGQAVACVIPLWISYAIYMIVVEMITHIGA